MNEKVGEIYQSSSCFTSVELNIEKKFTIIETLKFWPLIHVILLTKYVLENENNSVE